jgi:GNAT superfamily N-acetyltransferase
VIRDALPTDLPAIRDLLVRANDAPYPIAVVAKEKCFGRGFFGPPRTRVFEDDGLRGIAVSCGHALRLLAVDREHRRKRIGSALLRDTGAKTRVIFAEPGNYFTPGVFEGDEGTRAFFRSHAFLESRWTNDLVTENLPEEIEFERPQDRNDFLRFVEREFGSIWRFEAEKAFEDDERAFYVPNIGFSVHDVNNRGLGTFGPTGVAREMRRKGFGTRLLRASLADLRRLGYARAIIPWTDAVDFYRKACDAHVMHRFVTMTR